MNAVEECRIVALTANRSEVATLSFEGGVVVRAVVHTFLNLLSSCLVWFWVQCLTVCVLLCLHFTLVWRVTR